MRVNWCAFIFCASVCVSKEKNLQKLCQTYTLCNFLIVYGARVAKNLHIEEGFWRIFQCENSMILLIRMTLPKLTVLMQPLDVKILCLQFLVDYASMLLAYLQFIRADSQQIQSFIVNVVMLTSNCHQTRHLDNISKHMKWFLHMHVNNILTSSTKVTSEYEVFSIYC